MPRYLSSRDSCLQLATGGVSIAFVMQKLSATAEQQMYLAAAAVVAFTALLKLLLSFNKWWYEPVLKPGQSPLPPGTLGWPIFGNMPAFLRAFKSGNPDSFMARYLHKYNRVGLYKAFLFMQPSVLLATPEACKLIMKPFFRTGWPKSTVDIVGPLSFAGIEGDDHVRLRKLTEPLLQSPNALQGYLPIIVSNVKASLKSWSSREKILVLPELRRFTFLTILRILYGGKWSADLDEVFDLYFTMNKGIRVLPLNLPGTAYNRSLKARKRLVEIIREVIEERRRSMSGDNITSLGGKDILSLLMKQTDSNGKAVEDDQIIDMLNMFMNAGHDSTAHALMWLIIHLEKHPEVLAKLRTEQLEISKRKSSEEILTMADIKAMPYLSKVVDETLRLANIAPMIFRKACEDVEFNGFTIPKGWHVEVWLRQVHKDPSLHPEPHKFDPERWTKYETTPFSFIPFGLGNRTCPGNELAKLQIFVAAHYLVTGYEWKSLNPGAKIMFLPHPRPEDLYPVQITSLKAAEL